MESPAWCKLILLACFKRKKLKMFSRAILSHGKTMKPAPVNQVLASILMSGEKWVQEQAENFTSTLEVLGNNLVFFHEII